MVYLARLEDLSVRWTRLCWHDSRTFGLDVAIQMRRLAVLLPTVNTGWRDGLCLQRIAGRGHDAMGTKWICEKEVSA